MNIKNDRLEFQVMSQWKMSGLRPGTIAVYLNWVRRFREYCRSNDLNDFDEATFIGARRFGLVLRSARVNGRVKEATRAVIRNSIHAWSSALRSMGKSIPRWRTDRTVPNLAPVLARYLKFRKTHRGVAAGTLHRDSVIISEFLQHLRQSKRTLKSVKITDVDSFLVHLSKRISRRTMATNCSVLRSFFRFIMTTGYLRRDLSEFIFSPRYRTDENPPRALPWNDVQKLIRVIPRDTTVGRRDYSMLLLMASYGLGGGEVLGIRLEDIFWKEQILHIRRPKTGNAIKLPLLPVAARSIVSYLKSGRPSCATGREVFVSRTMPHRKLSTGGIRHRIRLYADRAGLKYEILGCHLFRHSHATRQIEEGRSQKIISDILGHRCPSSTSVYIRSAVKRLRPISLPVPR